jgi:hypothetical protein
MKRDVGDFRKRNDMWGWALDCMKKIAHSRRRAIGLLLGSMIIAASVGGVAYALAGGSSPKSGPTCPTVMTVGAAPGIPPTLVGHEIDANGCFIAHSH